MNIWAVKGLKNNACVKIPFRGYEISIAMDDSCGAFNNFYRSDIRVFKDNEDVSTMFFIDDETSFNSDAETLLRIMKQIDKSS